MSRLHDTLYSLVGGSTGGGGGEGKGGGGGWFNPKGHNTQHSGHTGQHFSSGKNHRYTTSQASLGNVCNIHECRQNGVFEIL